MVKDKNVYLRALKIEDAEDSLNLQLKNRYLFEQFALTREPDFYTLKGQISRINSRHANMQKDIEYYFGIFLKSDDRLIGTVNIFQIIRGYIQFGYIGYYLDKTENGKGYASEAVELIVKYAFEELKLHRLEAGVMPHNLPSMRVLEKAGFHKEGIAEKWVNINGKWEDHQVLALINPNYTQKV